MRKLVYFIACTADGFIAREDGSFDCFPTTGDHLAFMAREYPETFPEHIRTHFGVVNGNRHFGSVLMGRQTYEVGVRIGITNPYPRLEQFVVSSSLGKSPDSNVRLVARDPVSFVRRLKGELGLDIWLCGGAGLAGALYDEIDELVLKVNPLILGAGIPLFRGARTVRCLELTNHQTFAGGVAIHRYNVHQVGATYNESAIERLDHSSNERSHRISVPSTRRRLWTRARRPIADERLHG